jgi:hypothetical protein
VSEQLVGRCPVSGHPIYGDPAITPPTLRFTCLDPGRADGIYSVAVGVAPLRAVHPDGGVAGTLETVTGFVPAPQAAALLTPALQAALPSSLGDTTAAGPASIVTGS